uniref:Fungal lipase-like domain-containing protein n=1 Tax=Panagrolaimus sp. PS1159 TaxID=55785 RepID=A0AC35GAD1_9BILA
MKFILILSFIAFVAANSAFYDDIRARQLLSIAAGGFAKDPAICVRKTFSDTNWRILEHDSVFNEKLKGNLTYYSIINDVKREIIVVFAADEPKNQDTLTGMLKYNDDPHDFKNYGNVHNLFYDLETQIWNFVHKIIAYKDYHSYPVTYTGYSIGGAVATLAAMQTVADNLRESSHITLITFGEPRVGNLIFANSVDRELPNIFRITHRGDPIVHLPPCLSNGKYTCTTNEPQAPHHHGTEIFYDNDMRYNADYLRCTYNDEDANCSNGLQDAQNFVDHEYYFQVSCCFF